MDNKQVSIIVDGVTLSGTVQQIAEVLNKLGKDKIVLDQYYYSESKQDYVKITDMNTFHIWNAFMKLYDEFIKELRNQVRTSKLSPVEALNSLASFPDIAWYKDSKLATSLAKELFTR